MAIDCLWWRSLEYTHITSGQPTDPDRRAHKHEQQQPCREEANRWMPLRNVGFLHSSCYGACGTHVAFFVPLALRSSSNSERYLPSLVGISTYLGYICIKCSSFCFASTFCRALCHGTIDFDSILDSLVLQICDVCGALLAVVPRTCLRNVDAP